MNSGGDAYTVSPQARALTDATVTAQLRRGSGGTTWDLIVLITRLPDQPPLNATEVEAQLVDENAAVLPLLSGPSEPLAEAGGSLGMTANARFQFGDRGARLAVLVVRLQGAELHFRLTPG